MMKRTFNTLLFAAACMFCGCAKDAETLPVTPVSYTCFYNGVADFYGGANQSLVLVNNDSTRKLTYNSVGNTAIGLLNNAQYNMMVPGTYRITYTDSSLERKPLTDNMFDFQAGKRQTIYLSDSMEYFVTLRSDDTVERDTAKAKIRLIHLASDAPKVNLFIDAEEITSIQQVGFRQITEFTSVAPNIKPSLRIRYNNGTEDVTLVRKSFPLLPGRCYTLILRGNMTAADGNPNKTINLSALINQ